MTEVVVNGTRFERVDNIKSSVHGFYKELFTETESWRPKVDGLALLSLTNAAKEGLEGHFGEDEITRALFGCYGDKAPGPDGMTMAFLQANRDTVRVVTLFSEFHSNGKFSLALMILLLRLSLRELMHRI